MLEQMKRNHEMQTQAWEEYLNSYRALESGSCDIIALYIGFCAGWNSHLHGKGSSMWDSENLGNVQVESLSESEDVGSALTD